jgi:aminomethyltransferase
MGKPCIVTRTGYTGEDGFELVVKAEDAPRVWENLMLAGREQGIAAVGLGARDTLRLEAGMPLYGHELNEDTDPFRAGLGFAVSLGDRTFLGSDALTTNSKISQPVLRVGLKLEGRRAAREGAAVLDPDRRQVGEVTSGTFSPTLEAPISMAYVVAEVARPGAVVDVDIRGSTVSAVITLLPFYKRT